MYDRVGLYRGKKSICRVNNSKKHLTKRFMGNRRGYQALYVGRSMDEHSIDSNRSTDHGEQTEAAKVCKK